MKRFADRLAINLQRNANVDQIELVADYVDVQRMKQDRGLNHMTAISTDLKFMCDYLRVDSIGIELLQLTALPNILSAFRLGLSVRDLI